MQKYIELEGKDYLAFDYEGFCALLQSIKGKIAVGLYDLKDFYVVLDTITDVLNDYKKAFITSKPKGE